jgi:hypothetical protein
MMETFFMKAFPVESRKKGKRHFSNRKKPINEMKEQPMMSKDKIIRFVVGTSLIFGVAMTGCGGKMAAPTEKIAIAERAISSARDSNAIVSAPLDLRISEDKLSQAKAAIAVEEYEKAARLADEAALDADVARARTRAENARKISNEMRDSIDAMRKEIERKQK